MSADIQVVAFVRLVRRIVWIARTLEKTIPGGKLHRTYTLKLQRNFDILQRDFGITRSELHLLITELRPTIDGELVPDWLI